jgi:hypothetical protein
LGSHVYGALQLGQTDFGQDPKVALAVARIRDLEEQLARKEREIAEIRSAHHPESAPTQAARPQPPAGAPAGAPDEPEGIAVASGEAVAENAVAGPESDEVDPCLVPEAEEEEDTAHLGHPPLLDAWEEELSRWDEPGADEES